MTFELVYAADFLDIPGLLDASTHFAAIRDPQSCLAARKVWDIPQLAELLNLERQTAILREQIGKDGAARFDELIANGTLNSNLKIDENAYRSSRARRTASGAGCKVCADGV